MRVPQLVCPSVHLSSRPEVGLFLLALSLPVLLVITFSTAHAAPEDKQAARGKAVERAPADEFWQSRGRRRIVASAQLVAIRDQFTAAAMRIQGNRELIWTEGDVVPDLFQPWLHGVRDDRPFADLRPKNPEEVGRLKSKPGYAEYLAYAQALIYAKRTPVETFAKAAADYAHVKFEHIYIEPAKYRGKVIPMKGILQRLDKRDAPVPALAEGVPHFYEGWVVLDRRGLPPICVVFPDLPEGLKIGEDLDKRVSFDGYFFKKYRYSAQNDKNISTLLFVAPTLTLLPSRSRQAELDSGVSKTLLMGVIGCVVFTIGLIVALNLWYRHSDRHVRDRLTDLQASRVFDEEALLGGAADAARLPSSDGGERSTGANGPSPPHTPGS